MKKTPGTLLNHVLKRDPTSAEALSAMAIVCWCNQSPMVAIQIMSQVVALRPQSVLYQVDLGQMLQMVGPHQEAEGAFRAALKLSPNETSVTCYLALTIARQGRIAEGVAACTLAGSIDPRSPRPQFTAGSILASDGQLDAARTRFQAALDLDPNFQDARRALQALPPAASQGARNE